MQNKIHRKRKFNRVLHPNRHFIWAIVLIVLSGTALCAYILISSYKDDYGSVSAPLTQRHVFVDQGDGYSAFYPQDWQLEKDRAGSIIFENPSDPGENITVAVTFLKYEKVIRNSLNILNESDFSRGNTQYAVITTGTKGGVADIDVALVKTATRLYYISGHSDFFREFVGGFKSF